MNSFIQRDVAKIEDKGFLLFFVFFDLSVSRLVWP